MRYGFKQGDEFHKITRGVNGSCHRIMEVLGGCFQPCSSDMGRPKNFPDLVGQHLDSQAGDEAGQHCSGKEIGKKSQPKKPKQEKQ